MAQLILHPGKERSLFRRHPNVVPTNFPVSTETTANIVDSLERRITEGSLTASMLVPIAQRLGVGWVLVRNDLDWERIREPRPALLDGLRAGPLVRVTVRLGADSVFQSAIVYRTKICWASGGR